MCPNMNHFDAVDFSECHSEEVISFFWRSVYVTFWWFVLQYETLGHVCYIWKQNWKEHNKDVMAKNMQSELKFTMENILSYKQKSERNARDSI